MSADKPGKKAYPLRISAAVLDAMQQWSNDELRSLNAQIEYVLRDALRKAGRIKADAKPPAPIRAERKTSP
ncbi:MAG TPA: Arc family DNA binding domain-containing protein [Rhodanobacteraceae bacterium]|nr:Arc family DNA binding domain-containing protein [Rhodanobacteraceae bacterium]